MLDYQTIIDKYYPQGSRRREILVSHSRAVADLALQINSKVGLGLEPQLVETAAMLHDIGIVRTDAPGIECHGSEPYIRHGLLGADILRREGADDELVAIALTHTGTGITAEDIEQRGLPLPSGDYMPRTELQQLICYADKFYSKSRGPVRKTLEQVRHTMQRLGSGSAMRFETLHKRFGIGIDSE